MWWLALILTALEGVVVVPPWEQPRAIPNRSRVDREE